MAWIVVVFKIKSHHQYFHLKVTKCDYIFVFIFANYLSAMYFNDENTKTDSNCFKE
jgi:hypothetical protein